MHTRAGGGEGGGGERVGKRGEVASRVGPDTHTLVVSARRLPPPTSPLPPRFTPPPPCGSAALSQRCRWPWPCWPCCWVRRGGGGDSAANARRRGGCGAHDRAPRTLLACASPLDRACSSPTVGAGDQESGPITANHQTSPPPTHPPLTPTPTPSLHLRPTPARRRRPHRHHHRGPPLPRQVRRVPRPLQVRQPGARGGVVLLAVPGQGGVRVHVRKGLS